MADIAELKDIDNSAKLVVKRELIKKEGEVLEELGDERSTRDHDMFLKGQIVLIRELVSKLD